MRRNHNAMIGHIEYKIKDLLYISLAFELEI